MKFSHLSYCIYQLVIKQETTAFNYRARICTELMINRPEKLKEGINVFKCTLYITQHQFSACTPLIINKIIWADRNSYVKPLKSRLILFII